MKILIGLFVCIGLCMYQLENLVQEQLPELHVHFQSQGFQTSMYASSWFLTLFTTTLNLAISCRVMDVFLSEGMEFIFKMALAMLVLGKEQLLSMDMEAMLKVLSPVCLAVQRFVYLIVGFQIFTVFPKRNSSTHRKRSGQSVQLGIFDENQHKENEENGKGVRGLEKEGTGGNGRTKGMCDESA